MNDQERAQDFEWLLKMLALEEQRGEIVPGGAIGGNVARARRAAERKTSRSAAMLARSQVRFLARAVPAPNDTGTKAA